VSGALIAIRVKSDPMGIMLACAHVAATLRAAAARVILISIVFGSFPLTADEVIAQLSCQI
jgi:hypothetical protein